MKPSPIFFCIVVVLGFMAGFYFHEGLNEKVQYERDTCYEHNGIFTKNDLILPQNESFFDVGKTGGGGFGGKW